MPNDVPDWTSIQVTREDAIPGSPFTFPRDGLNHSINGVQIPVGCQWLVFGTAFGSDLQGLTVTGTTTQIEYVQSVEVGTDVLNYVRVHPALDSTVNIIATTHTGGGTMTLGVAFGYAPTVQDLDPAAASGVFLETFAGVLVAIDQGLNGGTNRVGVSLAGAAAGQVKQGTPDWQAFSRVNVAAQTASCASGVSGGLRTVLDEVVFSIAANANRVFSVRVWDGASGGTQIGAAILGTNGAAAGPTSVSVPLHGLKSSVGNPLTFDFDFATQAGEQQAITASGFFQT